MADLFGTQETAKQAIYDQTAQMWKSVGIVIRRVMTQSLNKNGGPFAGGDKPSEVDCEAITTWQSQSSLKFARLSPHHHMALSYYLKYRSRPRFPSFSRDPENCRKPLAGTLFDPVIEKYWE